MAFKGTGVEETLKGITRQLFLWLSKYYGEGDSAAAATAGIGSPGAPPDDSQVPARVPVRVPHATLEIQPRPARRDPAADPGRQFGAPQARGGRAARVQGAGEAEGAFRPAPEGRRPAAATSGSTCSTAQQRGPIDVEDLIDLVLTSIPEDTKVWRPGLEGWVRANQLREIADEIPPPLPIPGARRGGYAEEDMPDFNTVPTMLRTVLIADEDAAFRKYLAMPLAAQGFTIYEAADGSAAWQLAVQNRPWMILADISMPEVDGFEFCRRVRSHPLLARMPLLFISGSDKYKERYRALQIGADDFLSKNMPIRELLMRIQLLMTRYSDLSASGEERAGTDGGRRGPSRGASRCSAPRRSSRCAPRGGSPASSRALAEDAANTATVMGFREGDIISATAGGANGADGRLRLPRVGEGQLQVHAGRPRQRGAARPERRAPAARGLPPSSTSPARTGRRSSAFA